MELLGPSALVLLSGGQDSCTCLAWAKRHFESVGALVMKYGQRHESEIGYAMDFARKLSVPVRLIPLNAVGHMLKSSLTDPSVSVSGTGGLNGLPSTFTPGRNMLFLTIAASIAVSEEIRHVVIGCSQTDYSGYPDCRREFVDAFEYAFGMAIDWAARSVKVHTPLMDRNKAETFQLAYELGVLPDIVANTLTCYEGTETMNPWGLGCGVCPACQLRKRGYEQWLAGLQLEAYNG